MRRYKSVGVECITCAGAGERQVYRIERNVTGGGAAKHCVYSVKRIPGISLHRLPFNTLAHIGINCPDPPIVVASSIRHAAPSTAAARTI